MFRPCSVNVIASAAHDGYGVLQHGDAQQRRPAGRATRQPRADGTQAGVPPERSDGQGALPQQQDPQAAVREIGLAIVLIGIGGARGNVLPACPSGSLSLYRLTSAAARDLVFATGHISLPPPPTPLVTGPVDPRFSRNPSRPTGGSRCRRKTSAVGAAGRLGLQALLPFVEPQFS